MLSGTPSLADHTMLLLERVLDFRAKRHSLIVSNIGNAETPRYQAADVKFKGALKEAIALHSLPAVAQTNPRHLPVYAEDRLAINLQVGSGERVRNDRHSVDVDAEMAHLAQDSLLYNAAAQMLSRQFGGIRLAIDAGQ